ncbi:hypothetical protein SEUBUCD646_0N02530 [Saccharomyces eubayanus]|nr:hypothetical protein SEUBUCD646_0N02530 [Saccharomyces eubayanus]
MSRSNSIYTEDIEMYPTHNEQHLTREYTRPCDEMKNEKLNFEDGYVNAHGTLSKAATREIEGDLESETSSHSGDDKLDHSQPITAETGAPYTLLSYGQKWGMVAVLTMCGFWSSLGSPIYYPALRQLEKEFNVDENMINITVVVYLMFQGIAPTVCGGLADCYGRRPIILGGMLVYVVASIGLARAPSYGVIMFLRCVQSIGISPTIAISSGVVGDFTLKHERGTFVGATSGFVLLGQCFGSLIGAVLTARWDWRSIFWFLTIGCGTCFIIAFLILPETKRTIAGNLSVRPKRFINRAPIFLLGPVKRRFRYDNPDYETLDPIIPKLDLTSAMKILALPEIILSLFPSGLLFAMWTLMLSSISSGLSVGPYNYRLVIIGVCYLPGGIGGLLGSFFTGRVIDMYFKRKLKKFEEDKANGSIPQDAEINMFRVRLVCLLPQNFLAVIAYLLFGWSIDKGWRIESVLITSFVCSYCAMSTLSTSTTLLVDLYPTKSSTASSCFNFVRCSLSTIFMGCFAKMKASMTVGGTFTFLCALVFCFNFLMFIPMKYGMKWRDDRLLKRQT